MAKPFMMDYDIFLKDWKEYCIAKINKNIRKDDNGCWNWTSTIAPDKKARIKLKGVISLSAQRISFMCYKGEIPEGYVIGIRCRNSICVNPDHLHLMVIGVQYNSFIIYDEAYDEDMNIVNLKEYYAIS